jgi:hypothetical protein
MPLIIGAENTGGWGTNAGAYPNAYAQAKDLLAVNGDRLTSVMGSAGSFPTWAPSQFTQATANGIKLHLTLDVSGGMNGFTSTTYANYVVDMVNRYGPGGTSLPSGATPITSFSLMNETWNTILHSNIDPALYASHCRAAIIAGRQAKPTAKFYITLNMMQGSQGPSNWNNQMLAAQPDLFSLADGFDFHWYGGPGLPPAPHMDPVKNWAWAQPGGNGKPFVITEANLDAGARYTNEQDYVTYLPNMVQRVLERPWITEFYVYQWRGDAFPTLTFLSAGGTVKARCAPFKTAAANAIAASGTTTPGGPAPGPAIDRKAARNGTAVGTPVKGIATLLRDGSNDNATQFGGTDTTPSLSYYEVAANAVFNPTSWSVLAWARVTGGQGSYRAVVSNRNAASTTQGWVQGGRLPLARP